MRVQNIYLVSNTVPSVLTNAAGVIITPLNGIQTQKKILQQLGKENIRNVMLARHLSNRWTPYVSSVSYAPYISILRKSPLVLSSEESGELSEKALLTYLKLHNLVPQTITILGNYTDIGTISIEEHLKYEVYDEEVDMEPASRPPKGQALAFGVGRLPFHNLDLVSSYYANLLEKKRRYEAVYPEFIMIANSTKKESGTGLLLAETVSRATADELKNFNLRGTEFYREKPTNAEVDQEALDKGLIIYQGHLSNLTFFDGRYVDSENGVTLFDPPHFPDYPFVILQSCNSLDDIESVFQQGLTGMIGSSTRVHSASGSSFIKTYLDSILYRGLTTGEALREAKNYFLGIVKLKKARGHQEQAKTFRVALTFRLLGDPEMKLFDRPLPPPKRKPVTAALQDNGSIAISTPAQFHNRVGTELYFTKIFPNGQTAGVVARSKGSEKVQRRINSFYFFNFPLTEKLKTAAHLKVKNKKSTDIRNISLMDPYKRWIYVIHYPVKEKKNEKVILNF